MFPQPLLGVAHVQQCGGLTEGGVTGGQGVEDRLVLGEGAARGLVVDQTAPDAGAKSVMRAARFAVRTMTPFFAGCAASWTM